jgi:hypothetical protein
VAAADEAAVALNDDNQQKQTTKTQGHEQEQEGWRSVHEACITAVGSVAMTAVAGLRHPAAAEAGYDSSTAAVLVVDAARELIKWASSSSEEEPLVSAAGMTARDRQPGREAAAQGLLQLFGGRLGADETVLRALAAAPPADLSLASGNKGKTAEAAGSHTEASGGGSRSALSALAALLRRCTLASEEPERYVQAMMIETQRRMTNAQARLGAQALLSVSPTPAAAATKLALAMAPPGPELWLQRWCPHTNASSPM